ncbi:HEPN domain-containing protein [Muricoccus aerilatus]|uniref:HEPN domain-containing protein n=1 Tax=Muricoccus aerilatus TaxID=452982 RepID=UPI0012EBA5E1|nr:HEPN domain-containing protein [Roseomonas aerilata]
MTKQSFSIAVFPFLKTSEAVQLGNITFRSTEDVTCLPEDQASAVTEVAAMLFLKDQLRIDSSAYAILPFLEMERPGPVFQTLADIRAVVAYMYSSPHEIFDHLFLDPEEISMVLFSPARVSRFLVSPEHHTHLAISENGIPSRAPEDLSGYYGLYNFRSHFWVARGSRIYGPKPQMTLNISQNLYRDVTAGAEQRMDLRIMFDLLGRPANEAWRRIIKSVQWYNVANESTSGPDRAILNLAIAFEALLKLPEASKTDRLVDSISLLLGRTERLDDWARQFYAARSRVAHEGHLGEYYYRPSESSRSGRLSSQFGSLMLYARQVFQLCVEALLVGADLAERAQLREKFVSNEERYHDICRALKLKTDPAEHKLTAVRTIVRLLRKFKFVESGPVPFDIIFAAVRSAAETLLEAENPNSAELENSLRSITASRRSDEKLRQVESIEHLHELFRQLDRDGMTQNQLALRELVEEAWSDLAFRNFARRN